MAVTRPETLVREYRNQREYELDSARLQRDGWQVVSVLERPAPLSRLWRVLGGLWPALATPATERLVTYLWHDRADRPPRLVGMRGLGTPPRAPLSSRAWLLVLLVLLALLVVGITSLVAIDANGAEAIPVGALVASPWWPGAA